MNKMVCIQDAVKGLRPTRKQAHKEMMKLKALIPDRQFTICNGTICNGYVGSWMMTPLGNTCFYCPPIYISVLNEYVTAENPNRACTPRHIPI